MSRKHAGVPKGEACGLHQTPEFAEGERAAERAAADPEGGHERNPYDFFGQYAAMYAFDIGFQKRRRELREAGTWAGRSRAKKA